MQLESKIFAIFLLSIIVKNESFCSVNGLDFRTSDIRLGWLFLKGKPDLDKLTVERVL